MKLELNTQYKEVDICGEVVKVADRISTVHKMAIIQTALKNAVNDEGFYNQLAFENSFWAMLVLTYTDIKEKIDNFDELALFDVYDLLDANGIIDMVVNTINEMNPGEITDFANYATALFEDQKDVMNSMAYGLEKAMAYFAVVASESAAVVSTAVQNNG